MLLQRVKPAIRVSLIAALVVILTPTARSIRPPVNAPPDGEPLARIKKIVVNGKEKTEATESEVQVIRAQTGSLERVLAPMPLFANDQVITGPNVAVMIIFLDAAAEEDRRVTIGSATRIKIRSQSSVFILLGKILADIRGLFDVVTSNVTLGARGTEFEVRVADDGSASVVVLEGEVDARKGSFTSLRREPRPQRELKAKALEAAYSPGLLASAFQAVARPQERWRFEVVSGQLAETRGRITITNRCREKHQFEIRAPDNLAWLSLVAESRVEVGGNQSRAIDVGIKIDAANLSANSYQGDVIIKCLDCYREPSCAQDRDLLPVEVNVTAPGGLRIQRLEEITIGSGAPGQPKATIEDRVRSALNWTNEAILAGQPTYPAKKIIPHFDTSSQRGQAFVDARYRAIWRREPRSYETLGNIYSDWGEGAKAVEAYNKELSINPSRQNSDAFLTDLGEAYRLKGQLAQAERQLKVVLGAAPQMAPALNALGNVLFDKASAARDKADDDQARQLLTETRGAYERSLQSSSGQIQAGVSQANLGETDLTLGHIAQQERRPEDARRQYESAEREFNSARERYRRYPFIVTGLGEVYRGLGNLAQSQGNAARAREAYVRSETQYREALDAHPDLTTAYVGLGILYEDTGDKNAAISSYRRAAQLRPEEPAPYYRLGALLERENPRLAAEYYQTYLKLEPVVFKQGQKAQRAELVVKSVTSKDVATRITVPNLTGLQTQAARDTLSQSRLNIGAIQDRVSEAREGTIIDQNPKAGASVAPGSSVDVIIARRAASTGNQQSTVPDLIDKTRSDAVRLIEEQGLTLGKVEKKKSSKPSETVIEQKPKAQSQAQRGARIDLVIAEHEDIRIKVPDVRGDNQDKAVREINKRGLIDQIEKQPSCEQAGKVLDQDPKKNTQVPAGSAVTIFVADPGEDAATVPRVTGLQQGEAERALREEGLRVGRIQRMETDRESPGTVLRQRPEPNTRLKRDCVVDLFVAVSIPLVEVPDFRGLTEAEARRQLPGGVSGAFAELSRGEITYQDSNQTPGTVIDQSPAPRSRVQRGTAVNLVISRSSDVVTPPPNEIYVDVPDVVAKRRDMRGNISEYYSVGEAINILERYRLKYQLEGPGSLVRSQRPEAGRRVRQGTTVTLALFYPIR